MINIFYDNKLFSSQIEYTFKTLLSLLGLEFKFVDKFDISLNENDLLIYYGCNYKFKANNYINIKQAYMFSDCYMKKESMPEIKLKKYNSTPVLYLSEEHSEPLVKANCNNIVTNIDIIQSTFFMLSRYEEVILWEEIQKDHYGRFPAKESVAYKENFLDIPIVNEYLEWLWEWIDSFKLGFSRRLLCKEKDFFACISHDVDIPFKYNYEIKQDLNKLKYDGSRKAYKNIINHYISNYYYRKDPYWTFDYIMRLEDNHNFRSAFYFMTSGETIHDTKYNLFDRRIMNLICDLSNNNWEIGYHSSFNTYNDDKIMESEIKILKSLISKNEIGCRQHCLNLKIPDTWIVQETNGIIYDTSLCYGDNIGFRAGICFPFKVYDVVNSKELELWEIPLIVMDVTLKGINYLNLTIDEAIDKIKNIMLTVRKYKGVFTILWHNSSLDEELWKGWKKVFEEILDMITKFNGVGVTGEEIIYIFK